MHHLQEEMRLRSPGKGNIKHQKSAPSKAGKKVRRSPQNEFLDHTGSMEEAIDDRYAAAVAAAAIAVSSQAQHKKGQPQEITPPKAFGSLNKPKSKKDNSMDRGMLSRWLSIKEDKTNGDSVEKDVDRSNPKRTPSLREKMFEKRKNSILGRDETPADAWERAEIAKIRKRHENANETILQWEKEKKQKLRRKLEHKEAQLDLRRKVLLRDHREKVTRIEKIAKGARISADEKKRYDERKVMEKANQIRSTGKIPSNCFWL